MARARLESLDERLLLGEHVTDEAFLSRDGGDVAGGEFHRERLAPAS